MLFFFNQPSYKAQAYLHLIPGQCGQKRRQNRHTCGQAWRPICSITPALSPNRTPHLLLLPETVHESEGRKNLVEVDAFSVADFTDAKKERERKEALSLATIPCQSFGRRKSVSFCLEMQ